LAASPEPTPVEIMTATRRRTIAGKLWKLVKPTSRKRVLDLKVLTFDKSEILEAEAERSQKILETCARPGTDNTDHRFCRLLRVRQQWPCRERATKKTDKLTPLHVLPLLRTRQVSVSIYHIKRDCDVRFGPKADTGLNALSTKTHSRSRKCPIRGILHAGEYKRANDCDSDCCNACKNEDSHDPPSSLLRLATRMSAKDQ
jgi:hypothetical protein